jgi:hypothetical protein
MQLPVGSSERAVGESWRAAALESGGATKLPDDPPSGPAEGWFFWSLTLCKIFIPKNFHVC